MECRSINKLVLAVVSLVAYVVVSVNAVTPLVSGGRSLLADKCDTSTFTPIKPSAISSTVQDMTWEGADDKHVFILTKAYSDSTEGSVWRSSDGGSSFADITSHFSAPGGVSNLRIVKLMAQTSKPSNMLFITSGHYIWKSSDYGETVQAVKTPTDWQAATAVYRVHPYHDDWILAMVKRKECSTGDRLTCAYDLMLTKDAFTGLKWENLTANAKGSIAGFVDFDWAANLCPDKKCSSEVRVHENGIFATMYRHAGDLDQDWDPDVIFTASEDFFHNHRLNIMCGNQFELLGQSIYLALANSCPTDIHGRARKDTTGFPQGISLYTSVDGGHDFSQACLPAALKQASYELTETHDKRGAVAIVDYFVKTTDYVALSTSSIYVAGPHHAIFSLSLVNVFKDPFGITADFSKVEGIAGVYIANQMISRYSGNDDLDLAERDGNYVVTKITFNGGGSWNMITQEKFNSPKCNMCTGQPDCYLHLYGLSTWVMGAAARPAVYSHPSAPGIILGTGNTGTKGVGLGDNQGLCTWISRDGGATWEDIAEGAYIYEFADWGGVIVMAPHEYSGVGDKIMFSMDLGHCWHTVPLQTGMFIHNIRVEPDAQRPRVLVHGMACTKDQNPKCSYDVDKALAVPEGLVYVVDVSELLGSRLHSCKIDLDYEQWVLPTATHAPACLLGAQRAYTRRKANALCLQGPDYKRPYPTNTTCKCTNLDTECDYGYMRSSQDGSCHPIPVGKVQMCPLIHEGRYVVSTSGLRLVHNDMCEGVDQVIQDTDGRGTPKKGHRPHNQPGGGPGSPHGAAYGFFIFSMVLIAIGGVFGAWWKFLAGDGAKSQILDLVAPIGSFFSSVWGWISDKVTGRYTNLGASDAELNYFQPLGDAGPADAENHRPQFTL